MAFLCVFAFLVLVMGVVSLRPKTSGMLAPVEYLDIFALSARYRPMLRLLDGSDFDLLNDSGDPKLIRRIRSQRRAIFRGYLRSLRRDHARLCAQLRALIVYANTDRTDLAKEVNSMERAFTLLMAGVQLRLAVHSLGIGSVPADALMGCFERVRQQVEALSAPVAAGASASA